MTIFFTSDTHFNHGNIIKYCTRPFDHKDDMTDTLVNNWNSVVGPDDTLYHLGDFAFAEADYISKLLDRLNGKIVLVYGNHDKTIKHNSSLRSRFEKCVMMDEIYVNDPTHPKKRQHIVLCHYAMLVWNKSHHGSWMLHGHSHGTLKYPFEAKILDVGCDLHNYTPISYQQVCDIMKKKKTQTIDHHGCD